jgi:hypothetical protein
MPPEVINEETPVAGEQDGAQESTAEDIFQAEVEKLTQEEKGRAQGVRSTEFHSVNEDGSEKEPEGETQSGAESGGQAELESAEEESQEQEGEEPTQPDIESKKRTNWKKEALDSRESIKDMQEKLEAITAKLDAGSSNEAPPAKEKPSITPDIPDIEETEMTQEVKDLLEYTPGLDKMIASLAAKQVREILEKVETDRTAKLEHVEQTRESEQQETQYWDSMGTWFQGQYPELTLSSIRNSPDFNDWLEFRKNWVDAQLGSAGRYESSGAQKVFERYVKESNLASPSQEPEEPTDHKRMAAARSPSVQGKPSQPSQSSKAPSWADEVKRLTSQPYAKRYI